MFKFLSSLKFKESGVFDAVGQASVIGLHMVSGLVVGSVIGYFLDEWLGTGPWLKIVFFILGVAAGFRNVYVDTRRLLKSQEKQDAANSKTETRH